MHMDTDSSTCEFKGEFRRIVDLIRAADTIAISGHTSPDGVFINEFASACIGVQRSWAGYIPYICCPPVLFTTLYVHAVRL